MHLARERSAPYSPNRTHLPLMISVRFCSVTELNTSSKRATASVIGGATREHADTKGQGGKDTIEEKPGVVGDRVGRGSDGPRKIFYQHEKHISEQRVSWWPSLNTVRLEPSEGHALFARMAASTNMHRRSSCLQALE